MVLEKRKDFLINVLYFGIIALIVFIICRFMLKFLIPFIIVVIVAKVVQKPARWISERIHLNRRLCAGIMAVLLFTAVLSVFLLAAYGITNAATGLFSDFSKYTVDLSRFFIAIKEEAADFFADKPPELGHIAATLYDGISKKAISGMTSLFSALVEGTIKKTPSFLLSCIVSAVASFYIAEDFYGLLRFLRGIIGKKIYGNILKVKRILGKSIFCYFKGYLILLILTFAELLTGFLILKIKYALLLALIISFVDILPVLGTGTVLVPWGIAAVITGNARLGTGILILYALITVVRSLAEPKIIGKQIGINPLFTLIAVFIGARLSGFAGMVLLPIVFIVIVKYYKEELDDETVF